MADEKPQKVNIGFIGSQVLSARIAPAELSKLRAALGGEKGWLDIRFVDGTAAIDPSKVVYVLVEGDEHLIGFGT